MTSANPSRSDIAGKILRILILIAALASPVGCSASLYGAPVRPIPLADEVAYLAGSYGTRRIAEYSAAMPGRKEELRNAIVLGRMYAIDISYGEYEKQLTLERQQLPFAAGVASIALSGTGAAIADYATRGILAAIDTGLKGAGGLYDDKILLDRTIDLLQQTMRSNRHGMRTTIIDRLSLPDGRYPLELALADVERYYNAGTMTGGLVGVSGTTSGTLAAASALADANGTIDRYGPDDTTAALRTWWIDGGEAATLQISAWLAARGIETSVTRFLNGSDHAPERAALAVELGLRG